MAPKGHKTITVPDHVHEKLVTLQKYTHFLMLQRASTTGEDVRPVGLGPIVEVLIDDDPNYNKAVKWLEKARRGK